MSEDPIPTCFDCANAPTERLVEMFVDIVMGSRLGAGQEPALRPVFLKHGVAGGAPDSRTCPPS